MFTHNVSFPDPFTGFLDNKRYILLRYSYRVYSKITLIARSSAAFLSVPGRGYRSGLPIVICLVRGREGGVWAALLLVLPIQKAR